MSRTRFMLVLLFFVGALALLALGASAQTPPPASGTWYISDDTSYSDTSIDLVEGGIVIYAGGSLTLTNVVVDIFVDIGHCEHQTQRAARPPVVTLQPSHPLDDEIYRGQVADHQVEV